jgi:probable HAF family extracellular repeat protein
VGVACAINDRGRVVGTTGSCKNTNLPGPTSGPHAVMWERDGSVHDLGNLGGTSQPGVLAVGNVALALNDKGEVAGVSALPELKNAGCPGGPPNPACFPFHPFLWSKESGMRDLGVLPGDFVGAGLGMNDRGEVVGPSFTSPGPTSGSPRAFLYRDGKMLDLNALTPPDSPMYLLLAYGINDSSEIVGFGMETTTGDLHGFLAIPCDRDHSGTDWCKDDADGADAEADKTVDRPRPTLSENARKLLQQRLAPGRF